jgi:hypothetical protein
MSAVGGDQHPIILTLTRDEALVFWDFLGRFSRTETLTIEDQAEERILWNLDCLLEKQMAPFGASYADSLVKAREAVRDSIE